MKRLWRESNALSVEIIDCILLTDNIKRDADCNTTNEKLRAVVERMLNLNW